jgi:aminomethyltransferase
MPHKTALYEKHQASHAKIVDFSGWDMPLHYGSQLQEHHYVRNGAGLFDVSHMTIVDLTGREAKAFLQHLLANDVGKLKHPGKALYSCMLNEKGGIVDDLITYWLGEDRYRLIVNAGTREKDIAWLKKHSAGFEVQLTLRVEDLVILAIQGPEAMTKIAAVFDPELLLKIQALKAFQVVEAGEYCIARTGYTGEDGVEAMIPVADAPAVWDKLLAAGIQPCGLGARDTLRLEAGLNLYGVDMDETKTPLESNLAWTVAFTPEDRNFIGRAALEAQKNHLTHKLVGLVLEQKGVLRNHQKIMIPNVGEGEITSGSFSPTLQQAIALARVPLATEDHCLVDMRGQWVPAKVVKPVFVRHGKKVP